MGGYGSGYWRDRGAGRCESRYSIDLAYLKRRRMLTPGKTGSLTWSRLGEQTGSISFSVGDDRLVLIYRTRPWEGEWEDVRDEIPFTWTPMHLGGRRRWFVCPSCGRRCRVIYGGARFRCRRCHGLTYESQYERAHGRALLQAQKIRQRLGGSMSMADPFPDKPKGMHWRTYWRLYERHEQLKAGWAVSVMAWLNSASPATR